MIKSLTKISPYYIVNWDKNVHFLCNEATNMQLLKLLPYFFEIVKKLDKINYNYNEFRIMNSDKRPIIKIGSILTIGLLF